MKYFFDEFNDSDKAQVEEKLIKDKYYIDLEHLHRVYLSNLFKYPMQRLDEKNSEAEEKTLQYLYSLLKEGKLKMRRQILKLIPREEWTEEEKNSEFYKGAPSFYRTVGYKEYAKADDAISELRDLWNKSASNSNSLTLLESSVHFTLPETPWRT